MKQTAVEWLFEQIYGDTNYIGSYTTDGKDAFTAFKQAKEIEKQQIVEAFNQSWHDRMNPYKTADKYYTETYTKDVRYYIIDCGEDIRNTVLFDITNQLKKQGHYFIVNATCEPNQFDIKRVTKEQFYESNTRI